MRFSPIILIITCCVVAACSPDNPTINTFDDQWRLLVGGPAGLKSVSMPSGNVLNPSVWTSSSDTEPYPVRRVEVYRDRIYLLTRASEIIVLSNSTLQPVDTIAWNSVYGRASDIAFANATTAYLTLETNVVGVVDLTVAEVTKLIDVGGKPAEIAAIGNQLCVTIPDSNVVKIIDSRTTAVEATITVPTPYPTMVEGDGVNGVFCVVAYGAGKVSDDTRPKSTPTLSFIDAATRTVTKTVDVTARASEGPVQIPMGIVINASEYAYIPVQNGLMFASTRSQNRASAAQFDPYDRVRYNAARAEIICVKPNGRSIVVFNEFAENVKQTAELTDSINAVVGIAP